MTIADKYFQIYHSISRGVSYKPMLKKIGTRKMLVLPDQHTLTHGEAKSNTNTHSRANTRANRHGKIVQKHYHLPYKLMVSSCAIFLPFFLFLTFLNLMTFFLSRINFEDIGWQQESSFLPLKCQEM